MKISRKVPVVVLIVLITGAVASLYAVLNLLEFRWITTSGLWMFSIFLFLSAVVVVWMVTSSGMRVVAKIRVSGIVIAIAPVLWLLTISSVPNPSGSVPNPSSSVWRLRIPYCRKFNWGSVVLPSCDATLSLVLLG